MSIKSHFRGHPTIHVDGKWIYEDTRSRSGFDFEIRPCKKCGKIFEGSNNGNTDPCLGELPGVDNACCGHGIPEESYIRFKNGVVIRKFSIEYTNLWHEKK